MPRLDGHDGARYQWATAPVDFVALRAACWWIAWKATQGLAYVDPTFAKTRAGADAAGFTHKLAYHWLSANIDPVAQAEHFLATVGSFGHWGAMLDAEEGGITAAQCLTWCETVEDHLRRPCAVYSGLYVAGGTIWKSPALRTSAYGPRAFHLAAYVSETKLVELMAKTGSLKFPFHAWQFSSNGPVPGITGRADMNRIDDRAAYDRVCGLDAPPLPPQPPTPIGEVNGMLYCEDADTGKFWVIWLDAYGQRVACPLDESQDPDWDEYAAVQNAIGPLAKVPHAALQRLYDKRGRPKLPPTFVPIADHHHIPGGVAS